MAVANQKIVHINKHKYKDNFLQIGIDEWQEASKLLNYSAFKLYLYLAGNKDGYNLELSQKAVENATGIKKTAYHDSVKKLKMEGYLVEKQGNVFDFFTRPVRSSGLAQTKPELRSCEPNVPQKRTAAATQAEKEVRSSNREIDKTYKKDKTDIPLSEKGKEDENEEALKDYLFNLSDNRKLEFQSMARGLDKSTAWIRRAIEYKPVDVWEKYGFGLLKTPDYIEQIDGLIQNDEQKAKELKAKQIAVKKVIESQENVEHIEIHLKKTPQRRNKLIDLDSIENGQKNSNFVS